MKILSSKQGTPEWVALRARHFCASEAAAMLGFDKKTTRSALLRMKATGCEREFSDWQQKNLLDRGHDIEAKARPIAEKIAGQDLFPVVGMIELYGLPLLASFDGLTMAEEDSWENKSWNAELARHIMEHQDLPDTHWPQVEQGFIVSGARRCLFTVSDGTEEHTVSFWYESKEERSAALLAGWKQFAEDLANYQEVETAPEPVAAPIEDLPALMVEIVGQVTASNLPQWQGVVTARIESINTNLQTDQDFADADKMVKFLDDGEKRLDLVKSQAQSQAHTIDELFRAIDNIKATMRTKRLELNRLVEARKVAIRDEIRRSAEDKFKAHVASLNERIGASYMPSVPLDVAAAMKGKKTVSSLRDAAETTLSNAKIQANEIADRIQFNLNFLRTNEKHSFLFSDAAQLVLKDADSVAAIVKARILEHEAAEVKRLEEQRARIAAEEKAKAEAVAAAQLAAERAKIQAEEQAKALAQPVVQPAPASLENALAAIIPTQIEPTIPASATMNVGEIADCLGFHVTGEFLAKLGFQPLVVKKTARIYRKSDFPAMCNAIIRHVHAAACAFTQAA